MQKAFLKSTHLTHSRIDAERGIVYGVKLCLLGHEATFGVMGDDGKVKAKTEIVDDANLARLLALSDGRSIPVHKSHDWLDASADPIHYRLGSIKDVRRDEAGNLIGDFYTIPGQAREHALWVATEDPTAAMFSVVYQFDDSGLPVTFDAADLVSQGAATVAMLSCASDKPKQEKTTMTPEDKEALMAEIGTMMDEKLANYAKLESPVEDEMAGAIEEAAEVTDEDMEEEDAAMPAFMRAVTRMNRAIKRQINSVKQEAATLAEAKFTARLGKGGLPTNFAGVKTNDFESLVKAEMAKSNITRGRAIMNVARTNPTEYAAFRSGK